jgi:hypothetical protein
MKSDFGYPPPSHPPENRPIRYSSIIFLAQTKRKFFFKEQCRSAQFVDKDDNFLARSRYMY